jgi:regulator of sigma E protease
MIGGVVVNIIAGIVIFAMISFVYGEKYIKNSSVKNGIVPSELAKEYGFKTGDVLLAVNGNKIERFEDALKTDYILGDGITYEILREGKIEKVHIPGNFIDKFSDAKADFFLPRMTFFVSEIIPNQNAEKAGLLPGDKIFKVNEDTFSFFDEFQQLLKKNANSQVVFLVERNNDLLKLAVNVDENGRVGFRPDTKDFEYEIVKYGFFASFPAGWRKAKETIDAQLKGWGKIFKGDIAVNKAVQGPIGIAKFYGGDWVWSRFWLFTALISLGLAFMNILPIPALDGGHVLFLIFEMVIGKPLSQKFLEKAQYIGMLILFSLMILIFGNDIWQLFTK